MSAVLFLLAVALAQPIESTPLPNTGLRQLPEPAKGRAWLETAHARRRPEFGLRLEYDRTVRVVGELGCAPSRGWMADMFGQVPPTMGWIALERVQLTVRSRGKDVAGGDKGGGEGTR